jgi:regulator of sirC expression with transglutaminase-like and TPR domain
LAVAGISLRPVAAAEPTIAARVALILGTPSSGSYLSVKLALDNLIAPYPPSVARDINIFVDAVTQMAGPNPTDRYKLAAIRKTIYEGGPWNNNRPFSYDHADPFGKNVQNKLLSAYFRTRLGNCVTMPILFLILAERVGLNVSLATAPLHIFVRYTDAEEQTFNVEATSGGHFTRDGWYRQNMPMSDHAVGSGLYMRTLTKMEATAHMATTVMDWLLDNGRYQDAIDVANAILEYFPRDGYAMVKRGHAYGELLRIECVERFPSRAVVPAPIKMRCDNLAVHNAQDFAQAEAMGWQPST